MDTKGKRRALAVLAIMGGLWALVRRPTTFFVALVILYINCESWLGFAPLKPHQLLEVLGEAKEATIAAAGLLVAIASVTAFKHVKRLDLELSAANAITALIRESTDLLNRNRIHCESVLAIKEQYLRALDGELSPRERQEIRWDMEAGWAVLTQSSAQARADQRAIWDLARRLVDLNNEHGAILRSKAFIPFMLERARFHIECIAEQTHFAIPGEKEKVGEFLPAFFLVGAKNMRTYLDTDRTHALRFLGYLGGASSIGSTSVAPVSLINAGRTAWGLWKM